MESRAMKEHAYKTIWILLPIVLFFLSSSGLAQPNQMKLESAEFYKSRGLANLEKRQYDKAILDFNKALKINPNDPYAHYDRGRTYAEQGQYDLAISDYTKTLEIYPRFGDAYLYRGLAHHAKGQYGQAISDFTKALETNPEDAGTYYARGVTYYIKKEYEKSWMDIKKAQSLGYSIHPKFLDDLLNASAR